MCYNDAMNQKQPMHLKTRIVIAFLIIILIPLLVTGADFVWLILHAPQPIHPALLQEHLTNLAALFILVLLLTCAAMSVWLYRSISKPIKELARAARSIRDGNLSFSISNDSDVLELTELTEDFEEMRARLKESAEEKVDTDKESKELISNISHDLKTPITAIKGYVEGIMDGVADTPEKMDHYVHTIYAKANAMDRLIDELTIYAKIDTNRIPYSFARIDIVAYFNDCVDELRMELEEEGVRLRYEKELQGEAIVIADAEQLTRVVNNIVGNAVKYMDKEQKVIDIRLRDVGDFVQVEFEDNGRGIAQRDLARIFDRFYRTDTSRNSRVGGSGIGLSIVRKILEDQVWATSKEGVGTIIYFVLRKYEEPEGDSAGEGAAGQ